MTDPAKGSSDEKVTVAHAVDLLTHYSFDVGTDTVQQLIDRWLKDYQATWIRWAVIEALYQGRYKAVSVDQILQLWNRRQHPCYHFSYEFERLVCNKFPRNLAGSRQAANAPTPPKFLPATNDLAVLPDLPASSKAAIAKPSAAEIKSSEPPAWVVLAEQIQHTEPEASETVQVELVASESHLPDPIEDTERLLDATDTLSERVARLQAGVDALIEQATTSLNASTEAVKTKLLEDHAPPSAIPSAISTLHNSTGTAEISPPNGAAEEINPPIHQFTPASDSSEFHSKLKAVAEQENSESINSQERL